MVLKGNLAHDEKVAALFDEYLENIIDKVPSVNTCLDFIALYIEYINLKDNQKKLVKGDIQLFEEKVEKSIEIRKNEISKINKERDIGFVKIIEQNVSNTLNEITRVTGYDYIVLSGYLKIYKRLNERQKSYFDEKVKERLLQAYGESKRLYYISCKRRKLK